MGLGAGEDLSEHLGDLTLRLSLYTNTSMAYYKELPIEEFYRVVDNYIRIMKERKEAYEEARR